MYGKYLVWSVFLKIVTGSYQHRHQFVVCCVTDLPQGEPNLPVIYKRRLLVVFYPFEVHCKTKFCLCYKVQSICTSGWSLGGFIPSYDKQYCPVLWILKLTLYSINAKENYVQLLFSSLFNQIMQLWFIEIWLESCWYDYY